MAISFNKKSRCFHLKTKNLSYLFKISKHGRLLHLYNGKSVDDDNFDFIFKRYKYIKGWPANAKTVDDDFKLGVIPLEFPSFGNTDIRMPSIEISQKDGSSITDFRFLKYEIIDEKPKLHGLPSLFFNGHQKNSTLVITLIDKLSGLKALLYYSVFYDKDAVSRSCKIINASENNIVINRIMSFNMDFTSDNFNLLTLDGEWARENHISISKLRPGLTAIESNMGASSHSHCPFLALLEKDTCENYGNAHGFSLVYSGNFFAGAQVDSYSNTRIQIGISPFMFGFHLDKGASFESPEAVYVYSRDGLCGLSHNFHNLINDNLIPTRFNKISRPIPINSWESFYFDFDKDKILNLAKQASDIGADLFVLDDGWFGNRNDDTSSLGDWIYNEKKWVYILIN